MHVERDFAEEFPGADPLSVECYINILRAGDRLLAEITRRASDQHDLLTRRRRGHGLLPSDRDRTAVLGSYAG